MKRGIMLAILGMFCVATAAAQMGATPGAGARPRQAKKSEPKGLQGEEKLRWICTQLKLDEQQQQQAEALIAVYNTELKEQEQNAVALLQRIQDKWAEVQAAQQAGDMEAANRLREELRNMAPNVAAENNFFDSLKQTLTDEQKAKLPKLREQAETITSVSIRPVHVLKAVRSVALSKEQMKQLETKLAEYRNEMRRVRPQDKDESDERVAKLIESIRGMLESEQLAAFNAKIEVYRQSAPAPKPVKISGTPAEEGPRRVVKPRAPRDESAEPQNKEPKKD